MRLPYVRLLLVSRTVLKVLYIHTGFNDYCMLWVSNGRLMDFMFKRIS